MFTPLSLFSLLCQLDHKIAELSHSFARELNLLKHGHGTMFIVVVGVVRC